MEYVGDYYEKIKKENQKIREEYEKKRQIDIKKYLPKKKKK